ncbi:MAG: hypothetical protein LAQ30_28715 [Acidobacteriia bacterium]|nr:hypothetical protein [Terriglobia bacterium]
MASTAPMPSSRLILEERFAELLRDVRVSIGAEAASAAAEAGERARRETAEMLNQAVRRMRQAGGAQELGAVLVDAAARCATGAALFRIEGASARGECIRGAPEEAAARFPSLEIPLASAAALAGVVESLFPVMREDRVAALLCAWGAAEGAPLELFAQVAGLLWRGPAAPAASELVTIGTAQPGAAWDRLSTQEQELHLRAQRFARVQAAEMRLHQAAAVQAGRARRDLYGALRQPIDTARAAFRERFFSSCPSMVDYLHLEMLRTLANDDPELLGKDYPGPMAA